jgi:hypothetical protein
VPSVDESSITITSDEKLEHLMNSKALSKAI